MAISNFNLPLNNGYGYANQVMQPNAMQSGLGAMNPIGSGGYSLSGQALNAMDSVTGAVGDWFSGATGEGGFLSGKSMFGGEGSTGWFGPAMQGAGALMGGWNAMQQMDLAKEQFAFQKQAYQTNLANQTQLTNQALVDRQAARAAANSSFSKPDEQWRKQNLLPANK